MQRWFRPLLLATVLFEGLRAGAGTFRMILDLPARMAIGPVAFAEFSRATDLSPIGVWFYVLYGVGGLVLTGATWFAAWRSRASGNVVWLLGLSCLCSILIIVLTAFAAPLMWSVGASPADPLIVGPLLDGFATLTNFRIGLADLSFVATVLALADRGGDAITR
jgi:hypothetical protein